MIDIGNLIFVTPEMKSFKSKVGGLGDVAEELGKALAELGVKLTFVTPLYKRTRHDVMRNGKITELVDVNYDDLPIEDTGIEIDVKVAGDIAKTKLNSW